MQLNAVFKAINITEFYSIKWQQNSQLADYLKLIWQMSVFIAMENTHF